MTTVDIFIKTYHKDFIWLEYLLKSIKKFASGFRNIVIVSDNDGNIVPAHFNSIIDIKVFYVSVPKSCGRTIYPCLGYIWQQYVKLSWLNYTDADSVVIFDSDEMLVRPTTPDSFKLDGKYNWFYRKWEDAQKAICHKPNTDLILKYNTLYEAMAVPVFSFTRNATLAFNQYLLDNHGTSNLYEVFNIYKLTAMSEYNIFGNFIHLIKHPDYNYQYDYSHSHSPLILLSWSWGGLNADDKKNRDAILNS